MRDTTPEIIDALQQSNLPMLVLVELEFASGTVRLTNAGYSFDWTGHTWIGAGNLGSISAIEEGLNIQMYGCTLGLSGLAPEIIATALNEDYKGRSATIWLAPLNENYQILADPIVIFKGRMDTMPISLGEKGSIQLTIESKLIDWERPRLRRYNHQDQIAEYPDDMGLEYVEQMVEMELVWGRK